MCRLASETIERILDHGMIYEVGGAVRDRLLGAGSIKDRDYLVTGITYDRLSSILQSSGRVDLVGRSFGVIKFTQHRHGALFTFDIALPRKEFSTGAGHTDFAVSFDPDLAVEDDLMRRDFTINAMAVSLDSNELIDPLDGKTDLEERQLRITSPRSFLEDPLRMLRAVQFAARFDLELEPETRRSLEENVAGIATVSSERISEELNKLLVKAERPSVGFRLMQETGLLHHVLPELEQCVGVDQPGGYHKYDVFEHTIRCIDAAPPVLRVRMAALFHDITKPRHKRLTDTGASFYGHETSGADVAVGVLRRLRYGSDFIKDVERLVERHMFTTQVTDKGLRRLIRRVGQGLIFDLLDLRRADVVAQGMGGTTEDVDEFEKNIRDEISRKPPFGVADLAIDGRGVMELLDLPESPAIGEVLDYLLERVLDEPADNSKEKLEELARAYWNSDTAKHNRNEPEGTN